MRRRMKYTKGILRFIALTIVLGLWGVANIAFWDWLASGAKWGVLAALAIAFVSPMLLLAIAVDCDDGRAPKP